MRSIVEIWLKWYMDHCRRSRYCRSKFVETILGDESRQTLDFFFFKKKHKKNFKIPTKFLEKNFKKLIGNQERFKKNSVKIGNFLGNFQDLSNEISIVIFNYLKIIVDN